MKDAEIIYVIRDNEGYIKDTEVYKNHLDRSAYNSVYTQNELRGKMVRAFKKDAFSKGWIEEIDLLNKTSRRILSYEQLKGV